MRKRVPVVAADVVLALLFVGVNTWEVLHPTDDGVRAGGTLANLVVLDLFAACLALRRRSPLLCWVLMHGVFVLSGIFVRHSGFAWGTSLPACIATYTVARYVDSRWSRLALLSGPLLWLGALVADGVTTKILTSVGFFVVSTVAAWGSGRILGRLAARERDLEDARERLTAEQQLAEVAAVRAERARIALEMHDVVAVAVDAMVARLREQTRTLAATGDDVTRLVAAEETGRQALVDLRRTMGLLRSSDQDADRVPSLGDVATLVERFRDAGLAVSWHSGPAAHVPPGVSFAAYRILQEALTNALKHGDGTADAALEVGADGVVVHVGNPVAATPGTHPTGRNGLIGMRERVAAFGGSLRAGLDDDRFEVRAVLPTRAEVSV